jgi:phenylacetic acid degradation operon negative regulatory protein
MLERHQLSGYVDIFRGDYMAFGDLRAKVLIWWDFEELTKSYEQFISRFRPVLKRFSRARFSDQDAFVEYMHVLTSWRRIPDPRLAPEVLPKGWNGLAASALFAELNALLKAPARRHALQTVHGAS